MSPLTTETPLVSVIMFCRNRVNFIRRAIQSILNQTYLNWEFIIQDGASTDGTREAIESFSDPRIKLVSEPDSGPFDAMWRAYKRCQGEITGSCLSDEELLPNALAEGVHFFLCNPETAAIVRDLHLIGQDGSMVDRYNSSEFSFLDCLGINTSMALQSILFRRAALLEIGLTTHDWRIDCADFELHTRLDQIHRIDCYPGLVGKYSQQTDGQLSTIPEIGFFCAIGQFRFIDDYFRANLAINLLRSYPLTDAHTAIKRLYRTKGNRELEEKLDAYFNSLEIQYPNDPIQTAKQAIGIGKLFLALAILLPVSPTSSEGHTAYCLVAEMLECLLDIEKAMEFWSALADLGFPGAAERFLSAQLRAPGVQPLQLLGNQKKWAGQFIVPTSPVMITPHQSGGSILRLAFHATDWSSIEIRHQILPLLAQLDPEHVETICYASTPIHPLQFPPKLRITQLNDSLPNDFRKRVRSDHIDILIELSGLNPGNKFPTMAERCAPVQIAYLGHMGTTGLRQVDYQIADDVICPSTLAKYHTEKILTLAPCYCSFDIPCPLPDNSFPQPRRLDNRFTFGSFASTSLMNKSLLDCWARILLMTPHSRLLLSCPEFNSRDCRAAIRQCLESHNIPRESLMILRRNPEVISPYLTAQLDLYLDTFPHSDPTNIACCLSRGIPSLSLAGSTMAGRLGFSLLTAAGLSHYVAKDISDYEDLAFTLSSRTEELQRLKQTLPQTIFQNGLTNVPLFAQGFQSALRKLI